MREMQSKKCCRELLFLMKFSLDFRQPLFTYKSSRLFKKNFELHIMLEKYMILSEKGKYVDLVTSVLVV